MIKMIATDLDGTLLYPKRVIRLVSSRNKRMLTDFYQQGGKIALVTGRSVEFCQKIISRIGVPCDAIAFTGAAVLKEGELIEEYFIPTLIALQLNDFFEKKKVKAMRLYSLKDHPLIASGWIFSRPQKILLRLYMLRSARYSEKTIYSKTYFDLSFNENSKVYKMSLIFFSNDYDLIKPIYRELQERYGKHLHFAFSRNALEITAKGINKGNELLKLAQSHGLSKEEVAVVGDDANDIPMFHLFPHSFAMSHGYQEAKDAASHIIDDYIDLQPFLKNE